MPIHSADSTRSETYCRISSEAAPYYPAVRGKFVLSQQLWREGCCLLNAATSGAGNAGVALFHYHTAVFDNTVLLSPRTVLNVRYGFARWYQNRPSRSYGFDQSQIGMPASIVRQYQIPLFPAVTVEGLGEQYIPGERQRQQLIEEALCRHPAVAIAAAVGQPPKAKSWRKSWGSRYPYALPWCFPGAVSWGEDSFEVLSFGPAATGARTRAAKRSSGPTWRVVPSGYR